MFVTLGLYLFVWAFFIRRACVSLLEQEDQPTWKSIALIVPIFNSRRGIAQGLAMYAEPAPDRIAPYTQTAAKARATRSGETPPIMANENAEKIAALLHEAGEVHHVYYADVDGNDDDWATFYSEWLLTRTKFAELLARRPVRSGLTRDLVVFDEEYQAAGTTDPWPASYAAKLIAKYG